MKKDELINTIIELYKLWNDDTDNNYAKIDYILHKNITEEEYLKLYDNGNGDSYWTEWECE